MGTSPFSSWRSRTSVEHGMRLFAKNRCWEFICVFLIAACRFHGDSVTVFINWRHQYNITVGCGSQVLHSSYNSWRKSPSSGLWIRCVYNWDCLHVVLLSVCWVVCVFTFQAHNLHLRDQWLHSLQWKVSSKDLLLKETDRNLIKHYITWKELARTCHWKAICVSLTLDAEAWIFMTAISLWWCCVASSVLTCVIDLLQCHSKFVVVLLFEFWVTEV